MLPRQSRRRRLPSDEEAELQALAAAAAPASVPPRGTLLDCYLMDEEGDEYSDDDSDDDSDDSDDDSDDDELDECPVDELESAPRTMPFHPKHSSWPKQPRNAYVKGARLLLTPPFFFFFCVCESKALGRIRLTF
eukprot:TRINITY_DN1366_c0_g3_i2.p2 TRINITY_DN1366_c0_g3~~TRINITY_DN1366_c0_g3_i2.p2  ORF type:complete len:135 (+),score=20.94 TRINITY_DN1366_c0_g3_i2:78-482(+)